MSVSPLVSKQVRRLFAPAQADDVIAALDTSDLSLGVMDTERVHLAILLIARADMDRFRSALRQARQDWRDTLVTADLGEDDWPEVLKRHGIEISV